jgi:hypothetical protein
VQSVLHSVQRFMLQCSQQLVRSLPVRHVTQGHSSSFNSSFGCLQTPHAHLPEELLPKVLQHVQQQQRLHSCSLVCHAWHRAAAAATTSISVVGTPTAQAAASFQVWLEKHGSNVTSIDVTGAEKGYFRSLAFALPRLLLPCQQLQQLSLYGVQLLLPKTPCKASAGAAAAAAAAGTIAAPGSRDFTILEQQSSSSQQPDSKAGVQQQQLHHQLSVVSSLTSLRLSSCTVTSMTASDGLACLSTLSQLRHLQLHDTTEEDASRAARTAPSLTAAREQAQEQFSIALGALLTPLCQLTHLSIKQSSLKAAALQGLSNMQQLRELHVSPGYVYPDAVLQQFCEALKLGMPPGLQRFDLEFGSSWELPSSYMDRLTQLTGLLH